MFFVPWVAALLGTLGAPATASGLRPVLELKDGWEAAETRDPSATPPATGWSPRAIPFLFSSEAKGGSAFGWYRRTVDIPADWAGKRVFVRFGGVRWNARVFWDGAPIGQRLEGFTPWELELSATACGAGAHRLVVVAQDWGATFADGWTLPANASGDLRYQTGGRTLAPIGGQFWRYGIWDDVRLEARPAVFTEDLAIVPSVQRGTLIVRGAVNGAIRKHTIRTEVLDGGDVVLTLPAATPGRDGRFETTATFPGARLWSPESPHRYQLRLSALADAVPVDRIEVPFGFRELRAQGPDFSLNGIKRHLLATSCWPHPDDQPVEQIREVLKQIRDAHTSVFRLHTQPWREVWLEEADRAGVMIVDEGALWCDGGGGYAYGDPRFWANVKAHLEGMVRRDRNRASLVMWSLENELLHCGGTSAQVDVEAELAALGRFVKALDPSHLITYEADLDPKGVADVVGLHYPHELPDHHAYPDTADWLDSAVVTGTGGGLMGSRGAAFRWDRRKPLYIGEYLWVPDGSAAPAAIFFGDEAYLDPSRQNLLAKAKSWEDQTLAYRRAGVSALCPWTMFEGSFSRFPLDLNPAENPLYRAQQRAYVPVAAYVRERDTRIFRGDTLTRTFDVFNDSASPANLTLTWSLIPGGPAGSVTLLLEPAGRAVVPVLMVAGVARDAVRAGLIVVLTVNGFEVHRSRQDWTIHDRAPLRAPPRTTLRLLDPSGAWPARLAAAGLATRPWTPASPIDPARELLIAAPGALSAPVAGPGVAEVGRRSALTPALAGFFRTGGRAMVLEQTSFGGAIPGLATGAAPATMAFGIAAGDPLMAGLQPGDFSFWRPGHAVSRHLLRRPATGGARSIAVAGTREMLASTPALDLPVGRGRAIVIQALVGEKFDTEPAARRLFQNALDVLAVPAPERSAVVIGADGPFAATLARLGADATLRSVAAVAADLAGATLVILHGGGPAVTGSKDALARWISSGPAGRSLLWHAPDARAFDTLKSILGVPSLSVVDAQGPLTVPQRDHPLLAGVSREDLWFLGPVTGDAWMRRADPAPGVADRAFMPRLPPAAGTTIRAVTMTLTGAVSLKLADGSGVGIYANGSARTRLSLASGGLYPVTVRAAGTPFQGQYPIIGIRAAGREVARIGVTGSGTAAYTALAALPAGPTDLELVFDNDASGHGEDRNLTLASVTVGRTPWDPQGFDLLTLPTALVTATSRGARIVLDGIRWDAAPGNEDRAGRFASALLANLGMPFRTPAGDIDSVALPGFVPIGVFKYFSSSATELRFGDNGAAEAPFRCLTAGRYRIVVRGSGSAVADEYPRLRVSIDGRPAGELELRSESPQEFSGDMVDLSAGDHRLRIEFFNDAYDPPHDRNLLLHAIGFRAE